MEAVEARREPLLDVRTVVSSPPEDEHAPQGYTAQWELQTCCCRKRSVKLTPRTLLVESGTHRRAVAWLEDVTDVEVRSSELNALQILLMCASAAGLGWGLHMTRLSTPMPELAGVGIFLLLFVGAINARPVGLVLGGPRSSEFNIMMPAGIVGRAHERDGIFSLVSHNVALARRNRRLGR